MRTTLATVVCVAAVLIGAGTSQGAAIAWQFGQMTLDSAGATPLVQGMTGVLIADGNHTGATNWDAYGSLGSDSFLADPGDVILAAFPLNNSYGVDGAFAGVTDWNNAAEGLADSGGPELALFFFNTPYYDGIDTDGPGADVLYGFYRSDDVQGTQAAAAAYFVPANNATVSIDTFTPAFGGSVPQTEMYTKFVTVPEPATLLLLAAGSGLLAVRRRRKA